MNAVVKTLMKTTLPIVGTAPGQQDQRCKSVMTIKVQIQGCSARIALSGRFDFQMWRDFKNAYAPLLDNTVVSEIRIEMSKLDSLDSYALGMLILLNERAKAANKTIVLLIVSGLVSHMLELANLHKIFSVKQAGAEDRGLTFGNQS